jgi:protein-L-isoaspartate(D-aspartate) O-methyltransferase
VFAESIRSIARLKSNRLVEAFAAIPREQYVGPGPWLILSAPQSVAPEQWRSAGANPEIRYQLTPDDDPSRLYENVLVALDPDRNLNNGEPALLARCLDVLNLSPGNRFLHVGCGVGYYTAMATHVVGPGGTILALEVDERLVGRAAENLSHLPNVEVRCAPSTDPDDEPFDAILVNAGATEIQASWLEQLRAGGRLLVPLTVALPAGELGVGHMLLIRNHADGYAARFVMPVGIFHCTGARTKDGDARLRAAFARGVDSVQSLRRDPHDPGPECWLHAPTFCLSSRPNHRSA